MKSPKKLKIMRARKNVIQTIKRKKAQIIEECSHSERYMSLKNPIRTEPERYTKKRQTKYDSDDLEKFY